MVYHDLNSFESINPYTGEKYARFEMLTDSELDTALSKAHEAFLKWRKTNLKERLLLIERLGDLLQSVAPTYAQTITLEMGKPLREAVAEVKKCAAACKYYTEHSAHHLKPRKIPLDNQRTGEVRYEPTGVILGIMPWNFPFWQVIRFAVPTLAAGNVVLIKHAPNTPRSALMLQQLFARAGFPVGVYTNLFISISQVATLISKREITGVSITGSTRAGKAVASLAGQHLKPSVLELGGSNSLIALPDAQVSKVADQALNARFMNAGQSCISAKRIFVPKDKYDLYVKELTIRIKRLKSGNPLMDDTHVGPLARMDLADQFEKQIHWSVQRGAVLHLGGQRTGTLFTPALLIHVKPGMPAFDEELFGPAAVLISYSSEKDAIHMANSTPYGLGTAIFSSDIEKAKKMIPKLQDGAVYINEWIHSDPRLPFGGVKESGYGRELSEEGIKAFVNVKTVVINPVV
ncbi:MAG: NAD-dependent succinate-semialdehyde dehydrogenase [Thermaurantimonas sp.]